MYRVVDILADVLIFQSILNSIISWCTDSQLTLNADKSFIMHFGNSNGNFSYGPYGTKLPTPDQIKDLGVIMDSSLSFSKHIAATCSKARARCAIFFKTFINRDIFSMKQFYVAYIRPLLEYNSP